METANDARTTSSLLITLLPNHQKNKEKVASQPISIFSFLIQSSITFPSYKYACKLEPPTVRRARMDWFGLCRFMTPGLNTDFQCHMTILCLNLQITRSDIRPHTKWAVSLVIAYGHFIFLGGLCGYVWVTVLTLSPQRENLKFGSVDQASSATPDGIMTAGNCRHSSARTQITTSWPERPNGMGSLRYHKHRALIHAIHYFKHMKNEMGSLPDDYFNTGTG